MAIIPVLAVALLIMAIIKLFNRQDTYDYNAAYYATLSILRHVNSSGQAIKTSLLSEYKAALRLNNVSMIVGQAKYDKAAQKLTMKGIEL